MFCFLLCFYLQNGVVEPHRPPEVDMVDRITPVQTDSDASFTVPISHVQYNGRSKGLQGL
jgi:hypothetical protein